MRHTSPSEDPRPRARASELLPVALAATAAALACVVTASVTGGVDPGTAPLTNDPPPVGRLAGPALLVVAVASCVLALLLPVRERTRRVWTRLAVFAVVGTSLTAYLAGDLRLWSSPDGAAEPHGPTVLVLVLVAGLTVAVGAVARMPLTQHASRARLRELEHALDEARAETSTAVQSRSDLAATLSHELRTPLHALLAASELLAVSGLEPVHQEQLGRVRRGGTLALGLVDDVLDSAGLDAGRLVLRAQPLELADVLADAVQLLRPEADAKGVRLQTELDPGCPEWVRGDAPRLHRVLVNLLADAITSTDGGGTVSLEICRAARSTQPAAVYFQVTGTGTGTGVSGDQRGRLLPPSSRVLRTDLPPSGGTGRGLWTSQALVRAMGGEIVATSQEGVGSVLGFELALPPEPVPATVATALRGRRVAVLDGQPVRADQCAAQLRRWGAEVELGLPQQLGWTGPVDLVVVREDHPDALTDLGHRLLRSAASRAPLLLLTASVHAVPSESLAGDDHAMDAATGGSRRRAALSSLVRPPAGADGTAPAVGRPLRILLAEDDPTCGQVCELLLRRLGHDVDVVTDGAAGVRAAGSTSYDLVLMDSQMPELDGIDATRAIRAAGSPSTQVRVLALTGAVGEADQKAYALAGMDGILAKPVNRARLNEALADVPRRSRRSTTSPA